MAIGQKGLSILGTILFFVGVLVGMIFFGSGVLADFEAFLFYPSGRADDQLDRITCPVLISSHETGSVSAAIPNSTDREKRRTARAFVSEGFVSLVRSEEIKVDLAAGETGQASWTVFPEDAAYGWVILSRVVVLGSYPMPSQSSTCGVLVVNILNMSGQQIIFLAISTSVLLMIAGLILWRQSQLPVSGKTLSRLNAMIALTVLVTLGIILVMFGWWIAAAAFLLLSGFLLVTVLSMSLFSS